MTRKWDDGEHEGCGIDSQRATNHIDALLKKEGEIARLLTALVRIQGVLRPADNAANVETVGRAMEIIAALTSRPAPGVYLADGTKVKISPGPRDPFYEEPEI